LGYSFTLVIGQTFTAKDEHAISVLSAKKKPNAKPIAVPLVLAAFVAIVVMIISGKVDKKLALKTIQYNKAQNTEKELIKLQEKVGQNAPHLKQ